ncbi:response regulator transcription factor [Ammonicoccus fulvus]|uniref:Response regulator transcription factor n=1 Tax=Ammonicoccus fulvus TaxID=3138240 RepID=A0ABZ3FN43_9ACTN
MISVLVVDDQQLLRRGLRLLLGTEPGIEVVGEAADGQEALVMVERRRPDVVLADARMPGMDGLELVRALAGLDPPVTAVVLTTFDDEDIVRGAVGAGAAGFLLKDVTTDQLAEAIRAVARGGMVIDPRVARIAFGPEEVSSPDPLAILTRAERLVAERIARGLTNAEIAAELVIAEGTVKNHVINLLRKLGQRDRTGLALALYRALS